MRRCISAWWRPRLRGAQARPNPAARAAEVFAVYRSLASGGASTEAAAAQVAEVLVTWLGRRGPATGT